MFKLLYFITLQKFIFIILATNMRAPLKTAVASWAPSLNIIIIVIIIFLFPGKRP